MPVKIIGQELPGAFDVSHLAAMVDAGRREVRVNAGGGDWPVSPQDLAAFVRGGGVWVDWSGWPGWGAQGNSELWAQLLVALGINPPPMAGEPGGPAGFFSRHEGDAAPYATGFRHKYDLALHLTAPIDTLPGWVANPGTPAWVEQEPDGKTTYGYTSFAIRAGRGLYCYATWTNYGDIPFEQYAKFVNSQIAALSAPVRAWLPWALGGLAVAGIGGIVVHRHRRGHKGAR